MPTIFYIIFYPFFYSSCYRWVLMVTSKRYVLSTSRCHILGSPEQKTVTYQCVERPSSSELNLYSSCPLLYFTTGGIVALLRSSCISLKFFCKVGSVPLMCMSHKYCDKNFMVTEQVYIYAMIVVTVERERERKGPQLSSM